MEDVTMGTAANYGSISSTDPFVADQGLQQSRLSVIEAATQNVLPDSLENLRSERSYLYRPAISPTMLKIFALTCLSVILFQSTSAWTMPQQILQKASAVAVLSAAIAGGPMAAQAVDFSGSYADPNHPNCLREVQVVSPKIADVTGTDGNPGCPPDGSGKKWSLTGKLEGDSILIDFAPKGGPKDLKGVWEASPVPGIRFPDGNLWSKKTVSQ